MKNALYFMLKLLSFLRYLNFCPDIFDDVRKQPDKKAKVYFINYDVTNWTRNE